MKIEGIEFSHCYKLLIKGDTSSVNLPWITELMANFGVLGVIIGITLVGMFLAFLDRVFNSGRISDTEFAADYSGV